MNSKHCTCEKRTERLASLNSEGTRYYNNGEWLKALNKFTDALEVDSCDMKTRSSLLRNRSSAYTKLKKYEQAKQDAKESIRLDPKHPKAFIKLAEALEGEGDYEQACETYVHGMTQGDELFDVLSKKLEQLRIKRNIPPSEAESQLDLMSMVKAKHCFVCRSKDNLSLCARCRVVYYCCREHQTDDWKKHKAICKKLGEARRDEKLMDRLEVNGSLPYLRVKRGVSVPSITQLRSLDDVWGYLECVASKEDIFKKRMANCLSWPLTLAFGLKRFGMSEMKNLSIHVVGADEQYVDQEEGFFTSFLKFIPLPSGCNIMLIGPDMHNLPPRKKIKCVNGSVVTIDFVKSLWHEYMMRSRFVPLPHFIVGCHPGFHHYFSWQLSLMMMLENPIPCVFTSWDKRDYEITVEHMNTVKANIVFEGEAPMASPLHFHLLRTWNEYGFKTMNSYWVGIKGGR